jgi:DNA-binding NarL/FixJ family response regulator
VTDIDDDDRAGSARRHVDGRLHVAVVDGDQVVRHGLAGLLEDDPRLHLMDPVARIADLRAGGVHFDVCVLGLPESGVADETTDLIRAFPSVVCTAAMDWRPWVAAWVWGARAIIGHGVARVPLADAVWDAVHRPRDVQPQFARLLLDGISACGLHLSSSLAGVLTQVAEGRRVPSVLSSSGISASAYEQDVTRLRADCERAGLGVLQTTRWNGAKGHVFEPGAVPSEALLLSSRVREVLRHYADGYCYEEIAKILSISDSTVKTHVLTAMDKFGITSNRSGEVRLLFAIYMSGRHREPDLVRRRLDSIRDDS